MSGLNHNSEDYHTYQILAQGLESLDFARDLEFIERQVKGVPTFVVYP